MNVVRIGDGQIRCVPFGFLLALLLVSSGRAEQPIPVIDAHGPGSFVTSLAYSPDGNSLYAGGWDKVVGVWRTNEDARTQYDPRATLRVPIGPGLNGAINAVALSRDGRWLAVGGKAVAAGGAGFRQLGRLIPAPAMSDAMKLDQGEIYVFDLRSRQVRSLRGHYGEVIALSFVDGLPGDAFPRLVSAARERDSRDGRNDQDIGVVRLWDLTPTVSRPYVGGIYLPVPEVRPSLAAWQVGPAARDTHVAVAWGDGHLRLWNASTGRTRTEPTGGSYDNVMVPMGRQRLLVAQTRGTVGEMSTWRVDRSGNLALERPWRSVFAADDDRVALPRLVTLTSATPGGRLDLAAFVVLRGTIVSDGRGTATLDDQAYELRLIGVAADNFGQQLASRHLWSGQDEFFPVIDAAPASGRIAVAGNPQRTILQLRTSELLANNARAEVLTDESVRIQLASLQQKDGKLGLRLRTAPDNPRAQDLLLDVSQRRITPWSSQEGWQSAGARVPENAVSIEPATGPSGERVAALVLRNVPGAAARVLLPPGRIVTAYSVLADDDGNSLLAVGTRGKGDIVLSLYDMRTGSEIRQCTAHTLPIRSLQFSQDGRFLLSAGNDGLVCLWSLIDLEDTLGNRGAPGAALLQVDEQVVVAAAERAAGLREGDVLLGHYEGEEFVAWQSLRDAYDACWPAQPGGQLRVRRARQGAREQDIILPIVQAADERKPLCTLFVGQRDDEAAHWPWLVFTPIGPYESSTSDIEQYLGWHINTGEERGPVSFAQADQYRQEYRRSGLLERLLVEGRVADNSAPLPLARPALNLGFAQLATPQATDSNLAALLTELPPAIQLTVFGMQGEKIDRVDLYVDNQPAGEFAEIAAGTWEADLQQLNWGRGEHHFRAVLVTREASPQQFAVETRAVYYPPAPAVQLNDSAGATTAAEKFDLSFTVRPSKQDQPVAWSILQQGPDGMTTVAEGIAQGEEQINHSLHLKPGASTFEIVASNVGAGEAAARYETTRKRLSRTFEPRAATPLLLSVRQVTQLDEQAHQTQVIEIAAGDTAVVSRARATLQGTLLASAAPMRGTWKLGAQQGTLKFEPMMQDQPATFTSVEPIELEPGENLIELLAEMPDNQRVQSQLRLMYHPPLPQVVMLAPTDALELYAGRDPLQVDVKSQLEGDWASGQVTAELWHNGQSVGPLTIDENGLLDAQLPLIGGENRIHIRLSSAVSGASADSAPVTVVVRQPPVIESLTAKVVGDTPFADLQLQGTSASSLTRIEVSVNGHVVRNVALAADDPQAQLQDGKWQIAILAVPLQQGENVLSAVISNADGGALQAAVDSVNYAPAPPPLAEVVLTDPTSDTITTDARFDIRFAVTSESPLREIRILRDAKLVQRIDARLLKPDRSGRYQMRDSQTLDLKSGTNHVQIVAVNQGGEASRELTITRHVRPVRIEVPLISDHRQINQSKWQTQPSNPGSMTIQLQEAAPQGHVWIHGRVVWEAPDDRFNRQNMPLHLWVNGFHQPPVQLEPARPGTKERTFTAAVVLNRASNNRIELNLPRLSTEADCPLSFNISCLKPVDDRRLHLAIIGVGVPESEAGALQQRALEAFQAELKTGSRTEFATPAFQQGWVYGPITGDRVNRYRVQGLLDLVRRSVNNLSRSQPLNDVVVIYYEGGEIAYDAEQFYLTTKESARIEGLDPHVVQLSSVGSQMLSEFFTSMSGAHLMFLDVVRGSEEAVQPAELPDDDRTALLRFAWLREGDSPTDARLIVAMRDALQLPQPAESLAQVNQRISSQFVNEQNVLIHKQFREALIYESFVPAALSDLLLAPEEPR